MKRSSCITALLVCFGGWFGLVHARVIASLRHGYFHSWTFGSCIGNGTVYLTGLDGGIVPEDYDSSHNYLMTIDLDHEWSVWNGSEYRLELISSEVPNVKGNALWSNRDTSKLYIYGGRGPTPDLTVPDQGIWEYDVKDYRWKLDASGIYPRRYEDGVYVDIPEIDKHYWLGGYFYEDNTTSVKVETGTVEFATQMISFSATDVQATEVDVPFMPVVNGGMVNLNVNGIPLLVYMGGQTPTKEMGVLYKETHLFPNSWDHVWIYDINGNKWYKQPTTGETMANRTQFCVQAIPDPYTESYQLFVIGGANSHNFSTTSDVSILSIPSFHWFKASPLAFTRMSINCQTYGNQIMIFGGREEWELGIEAGRLHHAADIYNASNQKMAYTFKPSSTEYRAAPSIASYIEKSPYPATWADNKLGAIFTNPARAKHNEAQQRAHKHSTSSSGGLSTGAQAGIGVGVTVAGLLLLGALGWFLLRRRRLSKEAAASSVDDLDGSGGRVVRELRPTSFGGAHNPAEIEGKDVGEKFELDSAGAEVPAEIDSWKRYEAPNDHEPSEAPASNELTERYELP